MAQTMLCTFSSLSRGNAGTSIQSDNLSSIQGAKTEKCKGFRSQPHWLWFKKCSKTSTLPERKVHSLPSELCLKLHVIFLLKLKVLKFSCDMFFGCLPTGFSILINIHFLSEIFFMVILFIIFIFCSFKTSFFVLWSRVK